jgi:hypothetical protein
VWLFVLFVGIAHACGWDDVDGTPAHVVAATASEQPSDEGMPVGCDQFCKSDIPVVSKLPSIGDQMDVQPLIVGVAKVRIVLALPPPSGLAHTAYPWSDVPPFLRFAHLRL